CVSLKSIALRDGESRPRPGPSYNEASDMKGSDFDESEFFRAIQDSRARALLIGRRALVALGIPVLTADYDFWIHLSEEPE
ncbi:MAG: hypothetical protein V3T24_12535, partial [Longimicrobiales bacterium]